MWQCSWSIAIRPEAADRQEIPSSSPVYLVADPPPPASGCMPKSPGALASAAPSAAVVVAEVLQDAEAVLPVFAY